MLTANVLMIIDNCANLLAHIVANVSLKKNSFVNSENF